MLFSCLPVGIVHKLQADEAYRIGPAISERSYLDQDKLLEVAQACGAQVNSIFPLPCALPVKH